MDERAAWPSRHAGLRGRARECALLDDLVSAIRHGKSRSLILRGDAGIGKTALLEYLVRSASDMSIVRATGVEWEMELAYASLHQLCAPLLDGAERLSPPQRRALQTVFGVSSGAAPDRFLVGLGVLSLLSGAAEHRPVLCVIDDAQWLDRASVLTLAFVSRRLAAESVGIVFAARKPGAELRHLPELEVRGLIDSEARALLATAVRLKLDERVRDWIIAEAQGNPLALLELPHGLTSTQLASGFGLAEAQGVSGRIEESFARRLDALSDDARRLLILAAAEPAGDPSLLVRAAERLGIAISAVDTERQTGQLLALGARVTFRHPLARSAVYRSVTAEERRAAHLALAEATDREADRDRRAWHLAAAAAGPDEDVALELERCAQHAQARGGLAAAAALLARAVELSGDPTGRGRRAVAAAEVNAQAGAFDAALELLAAAETGPLDESQRARADLARGHVAFATGVADAPALLLRAACRLEPFDPKLARETYLTAWGAAITYEHLAGAGVLTDICRAIRALRPRPGGPHTLDLVLEGLALLTTDGQAAATPTLQRAATALTTTSAEEVLRWGWVATAASGATWDDEGWRAIAARQAQIVRDAGALAKLPLHLNQLGMACAWAGDLAGAASLVAEIESVAAETASPYEPYALLLLRALRGQEREASALIAGAIEKAAGAGLAVTAHTQWSAAILHNGLARYRQAASSAEQAASCALAPFPSIWALPELVEAATREGDVGRARSALERLADTTQPSGTDWALGIEARSRALLSDGSAAEDLYREATERLGRTRLRPELARAHLLYGEWLRREQRRVDAREQLRAAYDQFTSIGMEGFAERAHRELLATGEKVRKRTVETRDELTTQERQIARLASEGLSNAEIGARLFVSPRTVEWHLRKVFTKLDVHSRHELASALGSSESGLLRA